MDRRTFLKSAAIAGASLALPLPARAAVRSGIGILGYDIEGPFDFVAPRDVALDRANLFDALVAPETMYASSVDAMRAANPQLQIACYINAMHTVVEEFPEDWYCHTVEGTRVKDGGAWTVNFLMNPLSGWVDRMITILQGRLDRSGYDVAYIDGAGLGALGVSTLPPIDPRTGLPWTTTDWVTDMIEVTHRIRDAVGVPLWTNGIGDARRYYDLGSNRIVPETDRGFTEQYTRFSTWRIDQYLSPDNWDRTVAMTQEIGAKYAALTKVWIDAPQEDKDRWHRYALTTLLMGAAPGALYYFTAQRTTSVTPFHPYWQLARSLGAPVGPLTFTENERIAARAYEAGVALCNRSRRRAAWVADRPYIGVAMGQRVELTAHDGLMLFT